MAGEKKRKKTHIEQFDFTVSVARFKTTHLLLALKCPICLRQENSVCMLECDL